ncbi:marine proteobacterial sortase target protein [Kiloniella sp. EL199]|uniref:marine proteobacterial sortase target protein n=1 Tax=Kiloniella sp. EL199 TaxID=2107581 RepID=UPI000EA1585B|nr:marine proteobacterial sortase target protein [Kiloniella sp. EL199]
MLKTIITEQFSPFIKTSFITSVLAVFFTVMAGNPSVANNLVTANDMKRGSLLLKTTEAGKMVEAIQLATNVEIDINGPIARTKVTQRFRNPSNGWVEGTYVFPLPETSAVDTLKMQIGDRFIEGIIKPKKEARKIYDDAKKEGKKASLVEQLRPNLFTNSVANIGPQEIVVVQIEYQETVKQSNGLFSLRFPMVAAPRYNPKPRIVESVNFENDEQWGTVKDPVPDREEITSPVLNPAKQAKSNPVSLNVNLASGFPIGEIKSPFHGITTDYKSKDKVNVSLSDQIVPADRDFELNWKAEPKKSPRVALFKETIGQDDYFLAFVTPPKLAKFSQNEITTPDREVIFVIDNSGSMAGPSMRQAKESLLLALAKLRNQDRFNVIRFDDTYEVLFPSALEANTGNLDIAKRFVSSLEADGGTEMLPALEAALEDQTPHDKSTLRQIVFLTDGAIGNEKQMFDTIVKKRGRSRIFTVGIGSAPNSHFMNRASSYGKGTFTHIGSEQQVRSRMNELFTKLETPVLTDLQANWDKRNNVEMSPSQLPDLYSGEPVVILAKAKNTTQSTQETLDVSGQFANQPWTIKLPLHKAQQGKGIGKLWGRRKIAEIEGQYFLADNWNVLDQDILNTALKYGLISKMTSLVAVDITPSRPTGIDYNSQEIALNLPAGWDFEKVFGPDYISTSESLQDANISPLHTLAASDTPIARPTSAKAKSIPLPATATTAELKIILGILLLLATVLFMLVSRKMLPNGQRQ